MAEPEKERQQEVEEVVEEDEEEEEYVLLDLDSVAQHICIPENAPYVLTGLDTLNPILVIDNKIKLIGEYTETIGTCLVFNESDKEPSVSEQGAGPSEAKKTSANKQINTMAQLNKVLRFTPCLEADCGDAANKPS